MSLWRALMQGVGWRVGREVAEDMIGSLKDSEPAAPEETPAALAARRAREEKEREKARAMRAKEAAAEAKRTAKAVDQELSELKKRVERERRKP